MTSALIRAITSASVTGAPDTSKKLQPRPRLRRVRPTSAGSTRTRPFGIGSVMVEMYPKRRPRMYARHYARGVGDTLSGALDDARRLGFVGRATELAVLRRGAGRDRAGPGAVRPRSRRHRQVHAARRDAPAGRRPAGAAVVCLRRPGRRPGRSAAVSAARSRRWPTARARCCSSTATSCSRRWTAGSAASCCRRCPPTRSPCWPGGSRRRPAGRPTPAGGELLRPLELAALDAAGERRRCSAGSACPQPRRRTAGRAGPRPPARARPARRGAAHGPRARRPGRPARARGRALPRAGPRRAGRRAPHRPGDLRPRVPDHRGPARRDGRRRGRRRCGRGWRPGRSSRRSGTGLHLHDLVRDVFDAEFAQRNPDAYVALHRTIRQHAVSRLLDPAARTPRTATRTELLLLHRRSPLGPRSGSCATRACCPSSPAATGRPGRGGRARRRRPRARRAARARRAGGSTRSPHGLYVARSETGVEAFGLHVYVLDRRTARSRRPGGARPCWRRSSGGAAAARASGSASAAFVGARPVPAGRAGRARRLGVLASSSGCPGRPPGRSSPPRTRTSGGRTSSTSASACCPGRGRRRRRHRLRVGPAAAAAAGVPAS